MKKLFTFLTILVFVSFSFISKAQLTYRNAIVNNYTGNDSTLFASYVTIINSGGSTVIIKVRRTNISLATNHSSYFCWAGTCFLPTTSLSPTSDTLAAGDSSTSFIGYLSPGYVNGTDTVNYKFFDVSDTNNNVSINFTYDFATGIPTLQPLSNNYMNCTQSSMGDMTNITYSISNYKNARLVIRNLLGSVVKEIMLSDKQGTLSVSTAEFPSGIYLYFLYNNDEPIVTKKMIIAH